MSQCHSSFRQVAAPLIALLLASGLCHADESKLLGNRFLTLNTIIRVRQIEITRDIAPGLDESAVHTPAEARTFREAIAKA